MRVGIIGLQHESNTFFAAPTTLDDFRKTIFLRGEEVRKFYGPSHHELAGFFSGLAAEKIEAVPLFMATAIPGGAVTEEALDHMLGIVFEELAKAGKLDGLLVAPHGAGVGEKHADMDGYWLALLRQKVGPKMPIVCTLDAHANLTQKMVDACDATVVYRTNPHIDQSKVGNEAARILARMLRGEIRPTQAASFPRVAINIERQYTAAAPCKPMYDLADAMLKRPGVVSNSIVLGFPYADVEEMGSAFVVVTDNDKALAQKLADEMAAYLVQHRAEFRGQLVEVEKAIDSALAVSAEAGRPVCLLDMGDNVGGGGPADSTIVAHAIAKRGGKVRSFVGVYDPQSQEEARRAGVGKRLKLRMGGKTDKMHGQPLEAEVTVKALTDGKFKETQIRHGGWAEINMGETAVVETDQGMIVQLTSRRTIPTSFGQVTSCGLSAKDFQIMVAKGVQAPAAAYEPECAKLIRVNTPGVTSADMSSFTYKHRRKPLYPFEEVTS